MEIISLKNNDDLPVSGCSIALGCFDGVHIGHRAVISGCIDYASSHRMPSLIWTLRTVPGHGGIITDDAEKLSLIASLGADYIAVCDYDEIKDLSCGEFVDSYIVKKLRGNAVFCGYDFTFGRGRSGDAETLKSALDTYDINCFICDKVLYNGIPVSSTSIRSYLESADFKHAEELLGHGYFRQGTVIHGRRIGHKISFPTINLSFENGRVKLPRGVYKTTLSVDDCTYPAISNLGYQPTVTDSGTLTLETHALSDIGDIYGKTVRVIFNEFLRSEQKFDSLEALKVQIALDIKNAYGNIQ